jgi:hypothetical protein
VMSTTSRPVFTNLEGMRVIFVGHEVMRIIEYLTSNSAEISLLTAINYTFHERPSKLLIKILNRIVCRNYASPIEHTCTAR